MALGIYKQGQGHWTRLMTFLGGGVLVAWGAAWVAGQISKYDFAKNPDGSFVIEPNLVRGIAAIVIIIVGAAFCWWFAYYKPATSEFLISTEGEMKKVNWSSRREVMGSTWVVVGLSFLLAAGLFIVDLGFSRLFTAIGILNPAN